MLSMIKIWRFGAQPPAAKPSVKSAPSKPKLSAWSAVALVPGKRSCTAVKILARKRWLSADAPRFPVAKCDCRTCECRYQHYEDRRGTPRRGVDRQALPRNYDGAERRASRRDRRRPAT
jgi:hypothetical protein